jgi:tetratricopeptide (TPR) repeat protein
MSDLNPERRVQLQELENNFKSALELHGAGQLAEARRLYEKILEVVPRHADTLDLLGRCVFEQGEHAMAVAILTRAVTENPGSPSPWNHLGVAARAVGDLQTATKAFQQTVKLRSDFADGHLNLAVTRCDGGDFRGALEPARRAAQLAPDAAETRLRLGVVLRHLGEHSAALEHLEQAARLGPLVTEAYLHLSACHGALENQRERGLAIKRGILTAPGSPEIYTHLGRSTHPDDVDNTVEWARRAIVLRPLEPRMWDHLAARHHAENRFEGIISCARRSMILAPDLVIPYNNLATGLFNTGTYKSSIRAARAGLIIKPDFPEVAYILCQSAFCDGQPALGWRHWSSRYRLDEAPGRIGLPPVEWRPDLATSGPVLVCAEQGVGDEILYFSCLPDLVSEISDVVVECEPRCRAILERSFPTITVVERSMRDDAELGLSHDYGDIVARHGIGSYIFCGTLPEVFRRDVAMEPPGGGYLVVDPREAAAWKRRLEAIGPPPYIGVCWRSGLSLTAQRTMFYPDAVDLFSGLPDGNPIYISLQYGERGDDLDRVRARLKRVVHEFDDLDQMLELDRVAALMSCLDLVIAPSSTVCHLACSVGVPTIAMDKSNFMCVDERDPLFLNLYPVMRRDEVANPRLAAERTGEAVKFFLENGHLPRA